MTEDRHNKWSSSLLCICLYLGLNPCPLCSWVSVLPTRLEWEILVTNTSGTPPPPPPYQKIPKLTKHNIKQDLLGKVQLYQLAEFIPSPPGFTRGRPSDLPLFGRHKVDEGALGGLPGPRLVVTATVVIVTIIVILIATSSVVAGVIVIVAILENNLY